MLKGIIPATYNYEDRLHSLLWADLCSCSW